MAFDSKKTILLEKTYLYVRASLGFQLEGTSTEKIPTNNGFYRFFVDNLQKAIGNSYVNILYDSQDLTLQCFCSELYMDELMSSDSSAIEDVVEELKKSNSTILEFENGVSSAFESNHQDNVALNAKLEEFEVGVSSAMASNHEDNVAIFSNIKNFSDKIVNLKKSGHMPFSKTDNIFSYFLSFDDFSPVSIDGYHYAMFDLNTFNQLGGFSNSLIVSVDVPFKFVDSFSGSFAEISYILTDRNCNLKNFVSKYSGRKNSVTVEFSNNNFEYSYLSSFSGVFAISDSSYNILSSLSYSKNCSYFSNNRLTLLSDFSCPLNQDFCFDFTGGYLDLYFYSSLDVSLLNQCSIKFITDVGSVTIPCSTINFVVSSKDPSLIVCTNIPNLVFSSPDCKKLLGLRLIV